MKVINYNDLYQEDRKKEVELLEELGLEGLIEEKEVRKEGANRFGSSHYTAKTVPSRWVVETYGTTIEKHREAIDKAMGIFNYTYRVDNDEVCFSEIRNVVKDRILSYLWQDSKTVKSFECAGFIIRCWWVNDKVDLAILNRLGKEIENIGVVAKDTGPHFPLESVMEALHEAGYHPAYEPEA